GPSSAASPATVAGSGGIATFGTLPLNPAGSYTIGATSAGLGGATSNPFTVSAAAADHLAFGQQPSNTTAGAAINPAVTVQVLDQFRNLTTSGENVSGGGTGPG